MKVGKSFGFLFLISTVTFSDSWAKGGKQLILNLPSEERMGYCISKIETKEEEIKELGEALPERVINLKRQVENYQKILTTLLDTDTDEAELRETISSLNTSKLDEGYNEEMIKAISLSREPLKAEVNEDYDEEMLKAISISLEPLKAETKSPTQQTPKYWGQNLIEKAGKHLFKIRENKLNTLNINNNSYKDLKQQIENIDIHIEQTRFDNNGAELFLNHPLAIQMDWLKNEEKAYTNKLNKEFSERAQIQALENEFNLSQKQAQLVLDVILGEKDDEDPEVVKELYKK